MDTDDPTDWDTVEDQYDGVAIDLCTTPMSLKKVTTVHMVQFIVVSFDLRNLLNLTRN
jgi:hypothetical protein